jgi:ABC-type sugar transport system ATPase subunit
MKQKVAIARALANDPEVVLMDEPFANLDADLRLDLRRELRRLRLEREVPETVFVTHDQTEALSLADRIAVIFDGCLEQLGTPIELLARPATLRVARFLGVPRIDVLPLVGDVVLAVRPTDFVDDADADALPFEGTVVAGEPFAGGTLVTVRTPGGVELEVTLGPRQRWELGRELRLGVPADALHVFDGASGTRREDLDADTLRSLWEVANTTPGPAPASAA